MVENRAESATAVLIGLNIGSSGYAESLEELKRLVASAGIRALVVVQGRRERPDPAHFAGSGKVEEIRLALKEQGASLAIFNHMLSPVQENLANNGSGNPFALGERDGFLPTLGTKIWESNGENIFNAYIYRSREGRLIGYVRIPSYTPRDADAAVAVFGELMASFQQKTDGLVIDQLNNPGGSLFYLYALASMLSDQPLAAPRHRIAMTQQDVEQAARFLEQEPSVKTDADAKKRLGESFGGYPVSYEFFRHVVEFSRFIIAQWGQDKRLTDPTFLYGVDQINPSAIASYNKPILLLINELDFSGGDFFPAIMQDNKRATLFGSRTSCAGGYVRDIKYPNSVGVAGFRLTGSIAVRKGKQPIENLGVEPDVPYAPTAADMQGGFSQYARAVNAQMAKLLGGAGAKPAGR